MCTTSLSGLYLSTVTDNTTVKCNFADELTCWSCHRIVSYFFFCNMYTKKFIILANMQVWAKEKYCQFVFRKKVSLQV